MLACCSLLVAKDIFKEAFGSFILVGHTHDDIDTSFGTVEHEVAWGGFSNDPMFDKVIHGFGQCSHYFIYNKGNIQFQSVK